MTSDDLPGFYRSNDAAAIAAKRSHVRLVGVHLVVLVVIAFISGVTPERTPAQQWVNGLVGVLMLVAIIIVVVMHAFRFREQWFRARALAESAASAAWEYAMRAPQGEDDAKRRDALLLRQLEELARRYPELAVIRAKHQSDTPAITARMREVRQLALPDRLDVFLTGRIKNQLQWYRGKARDNARNQSLWFWFMVVAQVFALVAAAGQIWWWTGYSINPVGGLSALAAAFVAWTNAQRHADLANSYAAAADDLSLAEARCPNVSEEPELEELVEDVESAISREHGLWLARNVGNL